MHTGSSAVVVPDALCSRFPLRPHPSQNEGWGTRRRGMVSEVMGEGEYDSAMLDAPMEKGRRESANTEIGDSRNGKAGVRRRATRPGRHVPRRGEPRRRESGSELPHSTGRVTDPPLRREKQNRPPKGRGGRYDGKKRNRNKKEGREDIRAPPFRTERIYFLPRAAAVASGFSQAICLRSSWPTFSMGWFLSRSKSSVYLGRPALSSAIHSRANAPL